MEQRGVGDVIQQATTDPNMKVISQPPGIPLNDITTYAYQDETNIGLSRVYVVDTGSNIQHEVSIFNDLIALSC